MREHFKGIFQKLSSSRVTSLLSSRPKIFHHGSRRCCVATFEVPGPDEGSEGQIIVWFGVMKDSSDAFNTLSAMVNFVFVTVVTAIN